MGRHWSGNSRAPWHDYKARQIYHITLMKRPEVIPFGRLAGDWRLKPGTPGSPYLLASPLGKIIKDSLREISLIHPSLRIYQYALMPDHLHLILSAETPLDDIIGRKLAVLKVLINKRADSPGVFEKGFNDQILTSTRNLNVIYTYLRENAYRLAIIRANPDFFSRINTIFINGLACQAYGNLHLLGNPFKDQVVIHRADTPVQLADKRDRWLHTAANGGVLVSPFISRSEKALRAEAEDLGGMFILITHESFPERFKPAAHDFDLCSEGRLLIISLGLDKETHLSRSLCLSMNDLAEKIGKSNIF